MATPKSTLWNRDPHTAAKHAILRAYLQAWFVILGRHHRRIVYLDGFAGPGEYTDQSVGSPLVALDVAVEQRAHLPHEVVFYLIEEDRRRAAHLGELVQQRRVAGLPENFAIETKCSTFEADVQAMLDELDAGGQAMAPTFAFIDPFGWSGLPMTLVHRLLAHDHTEAFVNFNIDGINRFVTHPDETITAQMVELYGTDDVLSAIGVQSNRYDVLRELYGAQLRQAARYVRFFTMHRADGRPVYDLFFATNSLKGLQKMKEAMWRADPDGHYRFSDATDPDQAVLFREATFVPERLLIRLKATYEGRRSVPVSELCDWTLTDTPYLDGHTKAALRLGEAQGVLSAHALKQDGTGRRAGSFPPGVLVDFVPQPQQASLFS